MLLILNYSAVVPFTSPASTLQDIDSADKKWPLHTHMNNL